MNDDQLESLLRAADESAGFPAAPLPDLADRVRKAHTHRRQRTVRVKFAVALAGCYVAGLATMWIVFAGATTGPADVAERRSMPRPRREQDAPMQDRQQRKPIEPEFVAEKSRYELLRQMGDKSQRRGDLQTAVAYFGQALDAATDVERTISYKQDNWLLISLKKDRFATQVGPKQGDSI